MEQLELGKTLNFELAYSRMMDYKLQFPHAQTASANNAKMLCRVPPVASNMRCCQEDRGGQVCNLC